MNPRRYSQIERAIAVLDKSAAVDFPANDHPLFLLARKSERLTAALYILTALFSDSEPLKWELREAGALLLKDILSFSERSQSVTREAAGATARDVVRILSLLEIAYIADLVTPMNFTLFKKEVEGFSTALETRQRASRGGGASPSPLFEESFFTAPGGFHQEKAAAPLRPLSASPVDAKTLKRRRDATRGAQEKSSSKGHTAIKDTVLYAQGQPEEPDAPSKLLTNRTIPSRKGHIIRIVAERLKEERKDLILELIRKKGTTMIKDFSGVITGCSEKTTQRLLTELVLSGVLKKEGERRWSRYSLGGVRAPALP